MKPFLLAPIFLACAVSMPLPRAHSAPAPLSDAFQLAEPSQVRMSGYLGARVASSEHARLLKVDEDDLLDAFERRDVEHHAWQGEHVGKFLHAATLAWNYSGDAALKAKLDRVVARLLQTQGADGYLGTYAAPQRWTSWDVWTHKYNLLGLLTYYRYAPSPQVLGAARRIGDLLIATFPSQKSILRAGEHMGMAATSVLEPIVLLYGATGESKYLQFARYIVRSWDEPGGPRIVQSLLEGKGVHQTANAKAYEMMSNLVGLCELARTTGDKSLLAPVQVAWRDIVARQLYITGTTSHREHFAAPFDLPNNPGSNIGETCVTVTWLQLNTQLLRLTGAARYANEIERSAYNHLLGAQQADGAKWCYYTPLEGSKPFGDHTNCCLSSGPRGVSMLPQISYLKYLQGASQGVAINFFETSRATLSLGGQNVSIEQSSGFPNRGFSNITLRLKRPATFGLKVRAPAWAAPLSLSIGGEKKTIAAREGWATIAPRRWKSGDRIAVRFNLSARVINGEHTNAGRQALLWGPLVLAYDERLNAGGASFNAIALASGAHRLAPAQRVPGKSPGQALRFAAQVLGARDGKARRAVLVPFAQAGGSNSRFAVWMRTPENLPRNASLLSWGQPLLSRQGNVLDDIRDGDARTFSVTFNNTRADLDWFGVALDTPETIGRVVFAHGRSFHDGGWFDASQGKPQVQAQREKDGPWQTIGTLEDYPATGATDNVGLKDGQEFTLRLARPERIVALRVIGKPASGDSASQAFSSCAEVQAFAK